MDGLNNKIGIIADDFTGANDSGVQLALKGLRSSVIHDCKNEGSMSNRDVLIIDTNSRSLGPKEAKAAVKKAALMLQKLGYQHIYKKIDSTLRGNIKAELEAIEEVFQPELIVIAPALPKMGRTTKLGYHYINGALISETEFGRDPKTPVTDSYIPHLLIKKGGRKAAVFSEDLLHLAEAEFLKQIDDCLKQAKSWVVCDVERESDFQMILDRFILTGKRIVWVGSAGLIEYIPEALQIKGKTIRSSQPPICKTLTVSGSLSHITNLQLEEATRLEDVYSIKLDVRKLIQPVFESSSILKEMKSHSNAKHYIVYVESNEENREIAQNEGEIQGLTKVEISERIAISLGTLAKDICNQNQLINGLILTGGDTAKAVCSMLGINEMELASEIEPGLPFGRLIGYERDMWAVTKAGGFGNRESLINAMHFLIRDV
ncbi:four-carbon acid sugar kinase family protein [Bacillus sp. JJ1562]|uniref:four-carbon acid sugar kinase family protein n=1 Tax=Bacillus sp. JJ1562 TaxID=3122960 RepID=UPI003002B76D